METSEIRAARKSLIDMPVKLRNKAAFDSIIESLLIVETGILIKADKLNDPLYNAMAARILSAAVYALCNHPVSDDIQKIANLLLEEG